MPQWPLWAQLWTLLQDSVAAPPQGKGGGRGLWSRSTSVAVLHRWKPHQVELSAPPWGISQPSGNCTWRLQKIKTPGEQAGLEEPREATRAGSGRCVMVHYLCRTIDNPKIQHIFTSELLYKWAGSSQRGLLSHHGLSSPGSSHSVFELLPLQKLCVQLPGACKLGKGRDFLLQILVETCFAGKPRVSQTQHTPLACWVVPLLIVESHCCAHSILTPQSPASLWTKFLSLDDGIAGFT